MAAVTMPRSDSFRFRLFDVGDLADLRVLHGSPEAMRYLRSNGRPWSDEELLAKVDEWRREQAEHGHTKWRVELLNGTFIGRAGLSPWGAGPPELGYSIVPALWGRGLATQLAAELLRHAFDTLGLPEVIAFAMCGNGASQRVLKKVGMTPTHRARIDGSLYDFFHIRSGDP